MKTKKREKAVKISNNKTSFRWNDMKGTNPVLRMTQNLCVYKTCLDLVSHSCFRFCSDGFEDIFPTPYKKKLKNY